MAHISRLYDFQAGTKIVSAQVDAELNQLVSAYNDNEDNTENHKSRVDNPHTVTKAQVGLGSADNTSDANKPVSTAQATAIGVVQTDLNSHKLRTNNPHTVTKAQVGLGNVDNTSDTNKPVSTAQNNAINTVQANLNSHKSRTDNPHGVTVEQVGLDIVDNLTTNDATKVLSAKQGKYIKDNYALKATVINGSPLSVNSSFHATCNTAGSTSVKLLSPTGVGIITPGNGTIFVVTFDNTNTASSISMQLPNMDTPKPLIAIEPLSIVAGRPYMFTYYTADNGYFRMVSNDKANIGLSNVDDTSDMAKPVSMAQAIAIAVVHNDLNSHKSRTDNPHSVTAEQVGLDIVDNLTTDDATKVLSAKQGKYIKDNYALKATTVNGQALNVSNVFTATTSTEPGTAAKAIFPVGAGTITPADGTILAVVFANGNTANSITMKLPTMGTYKPVIASSPLTLLPNVPYLFVYSTSGGGAFHLVSTTKANVGLYNVDNTSDADKPISTAVAAALGDMETLTTDEKTNLVGAINEVYAATNTNSEQISQLSTQIDTHHYGVMWNKVTATMTRLGDAAGFTPVTTNFGHNGSVNTSLNNPFDSCYPWSGRTLCNIDIDLYMALGAGADITDCVTAFLGEPSFSYTHENGVWVYTPEFWGKTWDDGVYRYFDIADKAVTGYIHYHAKIGGRWCGVSESRTIGGTSKTVLLPKVGMPAKGTAMSTLHGYATNYGATVDNIYTIDGDTLLFVIEYATMGSQTALGNGVNELYSQSGYLLQTNVTASATVQILTSAAANCIAGAIFDIGSSDGGAQIGSYIVSSATVDGGDATKTNVTLTTDGTNPASITATTSHYWSVHGLSNLSNIDIGKASGYVGANSKANAYYRGAVFHANFWRYVLGAYRQTGTGAIWIAPDEVAADAVDALNTSLHTDTGLVLPTTSNYIQTLGIAAGLSCAPFCTAVGGSSSAPVGDYCYVPSLETANTFLLLGGSANNSVSGGRFCGNWNYSAVYGAWNFGAFPLLKTP